MENSRFVPLRRAGLLAVAGAAALAIFGSSGDASADHPELVRPPRPLQGAGTGCPAGFLPVPGGTLNMGTPDGEGGNDEHPQHAVQVRPFCMQKLEVTVLQYNACVSKGDCSPSGTDALCNGPRADRPSHPINCVDFAQATAYCRTLGARIPTEAEWEWAARGPQGRKFPWGNALPNETLLNACGQECADNAKQKLNETKDPMYPGDDGWPETAPVGSFPAGASPFGILDMAGNVYEWTQSAYCHYPQHTCASTYVMYRGGGWYSTKVAGVRAAERSGNQVTDRSVVVGIRCVK